MSGNRFATACAAVLAGIILFFLLLLAALLSQVGGGGALGGISRGELFFAVRLTLLTATVASLIAVAIALPASYLLVRHRVPCKAAIDALLYLPVVLSPVALGALLLIFFGTPPGRFVEGRLVRVVFDVPGIVAAQFVVVIGIAMSLVKATFEGVNPAYENIARTLGATPFQAFRRVLLPLSRHGIVAAFLLTWARAAGEFGATVMLAGATPMKTETLPVAVYLSLASADIPRACVFILVSIGIALGVLFLVRQAYARTARSLL
ncbi:MAG: ABC transporter permease [bacterium]|nr:ABC transporter permease [bacterium]